ncbi:MFS transporter [Actinotalea sp. JY-7876]|uniref:MFS transporter n=1 Tax=Actinotalea sp. JY-7876 TaxID=2758442 RepID=UPI00351BE9CA
MSAHPPAERTAPVTADSDHPAASTAMRTFGHILVNTAVANVTTSFLWFALTFWVYLGTRSVLATGVVGGAYMLFVALSSIVFGTIVDHHRKLRVMQASSAMTLLAFGVAGAMFWLLPEAALLDLGGPWFWAFTVIILAGAVVEQMRNIALSTTVTILVPDKRRANANGLVGTVQGVGFMVTSVFSGLSVGLLGMGWTLAIALGLMAATLVHLVTIRFPEDRVAAAPTSGARAAVDLSGSIAVIRSAPGLFSLITFATFNNLIGGLYIALMDPYGLELFSVEVWGIVLAVSATGFIVGGGAVAKFGLGPNPMRTMLLVVVGMGALGATFTIREWWVLYAVGMWLYMCLIPVVEAAEQTVIQRVVPLERQGRVFGVAMTFESAATPITAFLIAPLAEFWIIPYARSDAGSAALRPLLGDGDARGIALVFLLGGLLMVVAGLLAFRSPIYRVMSRTYREAAPTSAASESPGAAPGQPSIRAGVAASGEPGVIKGSTPNDDGGMP